MSRVTGGSMKRITASVRPGPIVKDSWKIGPVCSQCESSATAVGATSTANPPIAPAAGPSYMPAELDLPRPERPARQPENTPARRQASSDGSRLRCAVLRRNASRRARTASRTVAPRPKSATSRT